MTSEPTDKGACYFRADLQVHTPRDQEWLGDRPNNHKERCEWARRFVELCREEGVDAVGITDHHDVCLAKYVQFAAQGTNYEVNGLAVPDMEKQQPVVFPGMELTLSVPCQVIVLLDAECGPDIQNLLLTTICGSLSNEGAVIGPEVIQLEYESINDLDDRLRAVPLLKDRYIILPNVNDGGDHTCLRRGFKEKYKAMRAVGGYVDGSLERHGKLRILKGEDPNWGKKALGLFQTSDFRNRPERPLGSSCTWVKLGALTAEALRQACLARQSRIRQSAPVLPSSYITRIEVSDSTFMGSLDLHFNRQFNTLIGGRGTGKSTILEYLRFAMQDQPAWETSDGEGSYGDVAEKRGSLIRDTLAKRSGVVSVYWILNDVPHVVTCDSSNSDGLTLKVGDDAPCEVEPSYVRKLLPMQAYSQKQLSTVSTRTDELRRFIEQPIRDDLARADAEVEERREELSECYNRLSDLKAKERKARATQLEARSLEKQAKETEKTLPKLSKKLEKALKENPLRLREQQIIEAIEDDIDTATEQLAGVLDALDNLPRETSVEDETPQAELVKRIQAEAERVIERLKKGIEDVRGTFEVRQADLKKLLRSWKTKHRSHAKVYKEAEEEAKEHKEKLQRIKHLRAQEASLRRGAEQLNKEIVGLEAVSSTFEKGWKNWLTVHKRKGDLLEEACAGLTEKSGGEIEAELERGAGIEEALAELEGTLYGCRIREARWDALREYLREAGPVKGWMQLMGELRILAETSSEDVPAEDKAPELTCWELTPKTRVSIVERLEPEEWLKVALISLHDVPRFFYRDKRGGRIRFADASAGQQATALLKVLLREVGGPLIIDQPEDDLDNTVIQEVAEEIWKAKERRQIIFASHSANIVVNGDAELVIQCDYKKTGRKSMGRIAAEGAIDVPELRNAITTVMEGGEEAFELRRQKYGF